MKKSGLVAVLLAATTTCVYGQAGQFPSGYVQGNATASAGQGKPSTVTAILDRALGSAPGSIIERGASTWGPVTPSGDCTLSNTGVFTCLKTNGTSFGPLATQSMVTTALGGTGVSNSTNAANDILASNGTNGNFVHTAFNTLVNAFCTVSPSSCASIFGYVSPLWYGAKWDGSTDDTTAVQNTLTNSAGKTILFPSGTGIISSALTVPSNTTIRGVGWNSIIKTTATTGVFTLTNVSNVKFSSFQIQGSDNWTTQPTSSFGPISISQNGSSVTGGSGYDFQNLKLSQFNTTFWIYISTAGSSFSLGNLNISNNWFASTAADAPADNVGHNGNNDAIAFFSNSGGTGQFHDITISGNRMDATAFCIGAFLGGNITNYQVIGNYITNIGASVTAHCNNAGGATINAYGIAVYDTNNDGFVASRGLIEANTILNPYSSGIYLAGNGSITTSVAGNYIYGQVSGDDALLPRAAVSINAYTDIWVVGNFLYQGYGGVVATGETSGTIAVIGNDCVTGAGSSFCVKQVAGTGTTNSDYRIIKGNHLNAGLYGAWTVSSSGAKFATLDISDNTIIGNTDGLNLSSPFVSGSFILSGNTIQSPNTPLSIGTVTGGIQLSGNSILNTSSGSAGITFAGLPSSAVNGSQIFVSDGTAASSPCSGSGTGTTALRQNGAWKCF